MCNKVNKSDHYYGAFLAKVVNQVDKLALIDSGSNRGVYKVYTDNIDKQGCYIYIKYATNKKGDNLWNFNFSKDNLDEIKEYIKNGANIKFAFICSFRSLLDTEIGICNVNELKKCIDINYQEDKNQRLAILKKSNSPYLRFYGTNLTRENCIEIERSRINSF